VKALRNMLLLMFGTLLSFDQLDGQVQPFRASESPVALVRNLYAQVISHHPIGVTKGFDMTTFAPFLSKALHRRIDQTAECEGDWFRQYPQTGMKPGFGWLELGLSRVTEKMPDRVLSRSRERKQRRTGLFESMSRLHMQSPPNAPGRGRLERSCDGRMAATLSMT
jgi:hypothetical protein